MTDTSLRDLLAEKRHAEIIAAVDAMSNPDIEAIGYRGEAHYALGRTESALQDFRRVLVTKSVATSFHIYQQARSAAAQLVRDPAELRAFWAECSDSPSLQMGDLALRLQAESPATLTRDFAAVLRGIVVDAEVRAAWTEAFDLLVRGLSGEIQPPFNPGSPRRKVIVSGTGWSGSGAIYDYLREYTQIRAIRGESTAFEGQGGFRGFLTTSAEREACTAHAIRFFFRNMLGYYPMQGPSCFKELLTARNISHDAGYAAGAIMVVHALLQLIQGIGGDPDRTRTHLRVLCDTISDCMVTHASPPGSIVLLDNCIHVQNATLLRYLSNTLLLCCVRDPRTNYVALRREFRGYNKTPNTFIKEIAAIRNRFARETNDALRKDLEEIGSHMELVRFEDFVVSQSYRRSLAALAGQTGAPAREFSCFKPWLSFRNTQLHLDYEHPEEMEMIAAALPEFCVDFAVVPAFAAR